MKKTFIRNLFLTLFIVGSFTLSAQGKKALPENEAPVQETVKPARDPVAVLRGKLLYKRNQARKLEREAAERDPALSEKVQRLEAEIKALYCAAEPKLSEIYAEQAKLSEEIENMKEK
ncbi:MAG: hypothetical protein GX946_10375 [Oligosphaeraceae bacterium]|nr:hypothetical protein [Oligosphaeraceae bacterium]